MPTSTQSLSNRKEDEGAVSDSIVPNGDVEKTIGQDNSAYPFLTIRTFFMTILAAMGGFIFVRIQWHLGLCNKKLILSRVMILDKFLDFSICRSSWSVSVNIAQRNTPVPTDIILLMSDLDLSLA